MACSARPEGPSAEVELLPPASQHYVFDSRNSSVSPSDLDYHFTQEEYHVKFIFRRKIIKFSNDLLKIYSEVFV